MGCHLKKKYVDVITDKKHIVICAADEITTFLGDFFPEINIQQVIYPLLSSHFLQINIQRN